MDWVAIIGNLVNRIPIERVLFPPRDKAKAMEDFLGGIGHTEGAKERPVSEKAASTIVAEPKRPEPVPQALATATLPTSEETARELKRRLAKELYRAELDLSSKLRIAGKPCDCLDSKHTLGLEATAEELIAQEPGNPVYAEILQWIKDNRPKVTIEAIVGGQYDREYPEMASEFKGFRKRIMGTTALTAMTESERPLSMEEAKRLAAAEAEREVERRWGTTKTEPEK